MSITVRTYLIVLLITILLTLPFYITAYRIAVARLTPLDNYQEMVLAFDHGDLTGFSAPFGYRILVPLLAVPLLRLNPPVFSQLPADTPGEWIRATFALCTLAYLFLLAATVALYGYMEANHIPLLGNILTLALFWLAPARDIYLYPLIDAAAFFLIVMLYWAYEQKQHLRFFLFSLLGIITKELSLIVIGFMLSAHWACWPERRRRAIRYLELLLPAAAIYLLARSIVQLPGNEAQFYLWEYPARFCRLPALFLNVRGLLLNLYPLWPIAFAMLLFVRMNHRERAEIAPIFHWSQILVTLSLILMGAALDVKYNLGRLAFFSFPLFTPVLGWNLARLAQRAKVPKVRWGDREVGR